MYRIDQMLLSDIRTVYSGKLNDVVICRNEASQRGALYTLIIVKDKACAKQVLAIMEDSPQYVAGGKSPYLCAFSQGEALYLLFEYREERRLSRFMDGQLIQPFQREQACVNLIAQCMIVTLPPPLLALVLTDININLNKDNSVYFNTFIDLTKLEPLATQRTCANRCAVIVRAILATLPEKQLKSLKSFALLDKKIGRQAYSSFAELYKDIKLTEIPARNAGLWLRIQLFFRENKDHFFSWLLTASMILVVLAFILLLSKLLFGSSTFLGWGNHALEVIGTETLK